MTAPRRSATLNGARQDFPFQFRGIARQPPLKGLLSLPETPPSPDATSPEQATTALPPPPASLRRLALRFLAILAFAVLIHWVIGYTMEKAKALEGESADMVALGLLALLLLAYALLIATPFVPGIEIGLALLLLQGADIVLAVYLATVLGLSLAFLAGKLLGADALITLFADLRLRKACAFLEARKDRSPDEHLAAFTARFPGPWGARLAASRYLLLGALLNLPGNAMMGGGGGLSLLAGLSGLFRWHWVLLTYLIAVAPVPLIVWLNGAQGLAR